MKNLRVAFYNKLGQKEIVSAQKELQTQCPAVNVRLISTSHDRAFALLKTGQVTLAINDCRGETLPFLHLHLADYGLMAVLQKETYPAGLQMIDKDRLKDRTCFIICQPEEEKEEMAAVHNYYQLPSPLMAVNDIDEAAVLVAGGSGYFLSNEKNFHLLNNDTLQALFLLAHGRQMKQAYYAFWRKKDPNVDAFVQCLKQVYSHP